MRRREIKVEKQPPIISQYVQNNKDVVHVISAYIRSMDTASLIFLYAYPLPRLCCPISGEFFSEPVALDHPKIASVVYDRASIQEALVAGELTPFGIDSEAKLAGRIRHCPIPLDEKIYIEEEDSSFFSFLNNPLNIHYDLAAEYQAASRRKNNLEICALFTKRAVPIKLIRGTRTSEWKHLLSRIWLGMILSYNFFTFQKIYSDPITIFGFSSYFVVTIRLNDAYISYLIHRNNSGFWAFPKNVRTSPVFLIVFTTYLGLTSLFLHDFPRLYSFDWGLFVSMSCKRIIKTVVSIDILIREHQRYLPKEIIRDYRAFIALSVLILIEDLISLYMSTNYIPKNQYWQRNLFIATLVPSVIMTWPNSFLAIRQSTSLLSDCKAVRSLRPLLPRIEIETGKPYPKLTKIAKLFSLLIKITSIIYLIHVIKMHSQGDLGENFALFFAVVSGMEFLFNFPLMNTIQTSTASDQYHFLPRPRSSRISIEVIPDDDSTDGLDLKHGPTSPLLSQRKV